MRTRSTALRTSCVAFSAALLLAGCGNADENTADNPAADENTTTSFPLTVENCGVTTIRHPSVALQRSRR